ncbi:MAG: ribonuclease H family protein [Bacteroidales bacterium]|nr:ribonuclease H family protein [Candidatus Liminaster caballi]
MKANKYYVVWKGYAPGIYDSWEEAEIQISGYPDATFKAFKTQEAAIEAFREGYDKEGLIQEVSRQVSKMREEGHKIEWKPCASNAAPTAKPARTSPPAQAPTQTPSYMLDTIAVDAACSGNPGPMEYQGVLVRTRQVLFKMGPMEGGTNNIGEFLAIVHALALQEKQGTHLPIYSDSVNAQLWVRQGICKTKLEETAANAPIFDLIRRAESWLRTHTFRVPIYKWETKQWGEIPADFGRK